MLEALIGSSEALSGSLLKSLSLPAVATPHFSSKQGKLLGNPPHLFLKDAYNVTYFQKRFSVKKHDSK